MNSCFAGFLKYVVSPFIMEGPDVELPNFNAVEPPLSWPWARVDVLLGKVPLPCRRALLLDDGFEQDGLAVFGSLLELPHVFDGEAAKTMRVASKLPISNSKKLYYATATGVARQQPTGAAGSQT